MTTFHRGTLAVRVIKSLGVAKGDRQAAEAYARSQNWAPDVADCISKAAVAAMGTGDAGLVSDPSAFDFAEMVRPLTIIGRLAGLRKVPLRVRQISATSGATAYWSGEAQPRPISKATLDGETLEQLGVTSIVVVTKELLGSSAPSAESALSRDLVAATVAAMDETFIDPLNAGVAGVRPASVTNGVTPITATGSTLAAIDADLAALIQALSSAGSDLTFATFIMAPTTALYLSRLRGSGGALAYPGMSVKGGPLLGLPALVSAAVPRTTGSPSTNPSITLLDPSQILVSDDGGGDFEIATAAAVAMVDNPSSPTTMVSLFQTESAALRIRRFVNWRRVRNGVAQTLRDVPY